MGEYSNQFEKKYRKVLVYHGVSPLYANDFHSSGITYNNILSKHKVHVGELFLVQICTFIDATNSTEVP